MLDVAEERVLVVPTRVFHELGHFQGFSRDVARYLDRLLDPAAISFRRRSEMEEDPSFKQLIPYVLVCYRPLGQEPQLFQYTRGTGQGEGRLHRKRSVGIGGHISTLDQQAASTEETYAEGLRRELDEEIEIDAPYRQQIVGLINDDLTPVGQVHFGVVHLLEVERPVVRPRESDISAAGFCPVSQLRRDLAALETWSQYSVEALFGGDD